MSFSFYDVFFAVIFFLMPICLIVYGLINKKDSHAWYLLVVGCFLISCPLSFLITPVIVSAICSFLKIFGISASFSDTSKLSTILVFLFVFIEYKIYFVYVYWESRRFMSIVSEIIRYGQSKELPDCTKAVVKEFRDRILYYGKQLGDMNDPAFAEKQLYLTLSKMLSKDTYRWLYGGLTSEGEQLVNIRNACVLFLVEKGVISEDQKKSYLYSKNSRFEDPEIIRSMTK